MELALGLLLALAIAAAAWGWSQRGDALARERRLREEVATTRRTAPWPTSPASSDRIFQIEPVPPPFLGPPEAPRPLPLQPPRQPVPPDLVAGLRRHAASLAEADDRFLRETLPRGPAASPSPPQQRSAPLTSPVDSPLAEASRTLEQFLDQSSRLRADLQASDGAATRVAEAIQTALPLAREAGRQSQALEPFVSALSSFADRLNLLSIDADLGTPSAERQGRGPQAAAEIRSLYDEARTLARDLGYRARRAAEAAQRSQEAFLEAGTTSEGAHERTTRAREQGEKLAAVGRSLESSLAALRSAADTLRLEREKLARSLSASESRLLAERKSREESSVEAARNAEALSFVGEVVSAERQAAERLLDELEALEASTPRA